MDAGSEEWVTMTAQNIWDKPSIIAITFKNFLFVLFLQIKVY